MSGDERDKSRDFEGQEALSLLEKAVEASGVAGPSPNPFGRTRGKR